MHKIYNNRHIFLENYKMKNILNLFDNKIKISPQKKIVICILKTKYFLSLVYINKKSVNLVPFQNGILYPTGNCFLGKLNIHNFLCIISASNIKYSELGKLYIYSSDFYNIIDGDKEIIFEV